MLQEPQRTPPHTTPREPLELRDLHPSSSAPPPQLSQPVGLQVHTDVYIDNSGFLQFHFGLGGDAGHPAEASGIDSAVLLDSHFRGVSLLTGKGLSVKDIRELLFDPDSLPEGNFEPGARVPTNGRHLKLVREEIFPALAAALVCNGGVPVARGGAGADLLCIENPFGRDQSGGNIQIKVLHADSPVLERRTEGQRKRFLKLVSTARTVDGLLLVQESASAEQISELRYALKEHGVHGKVVSLLMRQDLRDAGVSIEETQSFPQERIRATQSDSRSLSMISQALRPEDGFFPVRLRIDIPRLLGFLERRHRPTV